MPNDEHLSVNQEPNDESLLSRNNSGGILTQKRKDAKAQAECEPPTWHSEREKAAGYAALQTPRASRLRQLFWRGWCGSSVGGRWRGSGSFWGQPWPIRKDRSCLVGGSNRWRLARSRERNWLLGRVYELFLELCGPAAMQLYLQHRQNHREKKKGCCRIFRDLRKDCARARAEQGVRRAATERQARACFLFRKLDQHQKHQYHAVHDHQRRENEINQKTQ